MKALRYAASVLFIGWVSVLYAQQTKAIVLEAPDLPQDTAPLYWPGGLPPYHLMLVYTVPLRDDLPITVPDSVRSLVDQSPLFPGGEDALRTFFRENVNYPRSALEIASEGRVRVVFVVQRDGSITDVSVPKGERCAELHQEACRLVQCMPSWVPAQKDGSPVAARTSVSILFRVPR